MLDRHQSGSVFPEFPLRSGLDEGDGIVLIISVGKLSGSKGMINHSGREERLISGAAADIKAAPLCCGAPAALRAAKNSDESGKSGR